MKTKSGKCIIGMSLIFSALAATTNSASSNMSGFEDCRRISADELNDMRGGFLINAGGMQFLLSLGIERTTFVNGDLVTKSTFNLLPSLNAADLRSAIYSQVNAAIQQHAPSASVPATADTGPTGVPSSAPISAPIADTPSSSASGVVMGIPSTTAFAAAEGVPGSAAFAPAADTPSSAASATAAGGPSTTASGLAAGGPPSAASSGAAGTHVAQSTQPAPPSSAPPAPSSAPPAPSSAPIATGNYQSIQVVQIGGGNTFTLTGAQNLPAGTLAVIQNTLDNQVIRNLTTINVALATRDLLRSMALSAALSRIPANFGR